MVPATEQLSRFQCYLHRFLHLLLSISQRRQRRRLLIWDPDTLSGSSISDEAEEHRVF